MLKTNPNKFNRLLKFKVVKNLFKNSRINMRDLKNI
jgi:hypothetical protein